MRGEAEDQTGYGRYSKTKGNPVLIDLFF